MQTDNVTAVNKVVHIMRGDQLGVKDQFLTKVLYMYVNKEVITRRKTDSI